MIYEFAAAVLFLDDRGAGTLHKGSGEIADFPAEPELCDVRAGTGAGASLFVKQGRGVVLTKFGRVYEETGAGGIEFTF